MRFKTLEQWLAWQETLHPSEIELGLERVAKVWRRLWSKTFPCPVITVAGTNGKGSTVAMLQSIYQAAGYRTGVYTSPHLLRYNERIRIDGSEVSDEQLCDAFQKVDDARAEISLTYFEFGTLAALWLFVNASPDVVILEVGMGGRLDAVNIIDPDVAIVTSVSMDHQDWLGQDREAIGREKAGIFRSDRPALIGDPDPPASVPEQAYSLGAKLYCIGKEYLYIDHQTSWEWRAPPVIRSGLPYPALRGAEQLNNAATVIMALQCLASELPVSPEHIRTGLLDVALPGRFQVIPGEVPIILDVAHNPDAVQKLVANLARHPHAGRTIAIVGMMNDKDIESVAAIMKNQVTDWYACGLPVARAASPHVLAHRLGAGGALSAMAFEHVKQALEKAMRELVTGDRVVVFGSFYTVAEAMKCLSEIR